jgi:hypothetical protein
MAEGRAERNIAGFATWSALVVYLAVWTVGLGLALDGSWMLGSATALVYVGLHVFEIRRRGHSFMAADAMALPVSFLAFSAAVVVLALAGRPPLEGKAVALCWVAYLGVFVAGHLLARSYAAVLRARIRAEREQLAEPADGPPAAPVPPENPA